MSLSLLDQKNVFTYRIPVLKSNLTIKDDFFIDKTVQLEQHMTTLAFSATDRWRCTLKV